MLDATLNGLIQRAAERITHRSNVGEYDSDDLGELFDEFTEELHRQLKLIRQPSPVLAALQGFTPHVSNVPNDALAQRAAVADYWDEADKKEAAPQNRFEMGNCTQCGDHDPQLLDGLCNVCEEG